MAAGRGQVGGVGGEVFAALGTVVLRVAQDDVARSSGDEVAEVVESPSELVVTVGPVATVGARLPLGVAAAVKDLGRGQVLDASDAFGGVGAIFSGSWHGCNLLIEPPLPRDYGDFLHAVHAQAR